MLRLGWVLLFIALDARATIYGYDDRLNFFDVTQKEIREASLSTTALVSTQKFEALDLGNYLLAPEKNLLCPAEKFSEESRIAKCSGVLVAKNKVLTAGHCLFPSDCSNTAFVFGYQKQNGSQNLFKVSSQQIYRCKKILAWQNESRRDDNALEYALIELDRDVAAPYRPIKIAESLPAVASPVFTLGYPRGLPLKLSSGIIRNTIKTHDNILFETNLDTSPGSSGGPLLNSQGQLLGVVVNGDPDFKKSGICQTERHCSDTSCQGTYAISVEVLKTQTGF